MARPRGRGSLGLEPAGPAGLFLGRGRRDRRLASPAPSSAGPPPAATPGSPATRQPLGRDRGHRVLVWVARQPKVQGGGRSRRDCHWPRFHAFSSPHYPQVSRQPKEKLHEDEGEPVPDPRRARSPRSAACRSSRAVAGGGRSNFIGVLAGSLAVLRALRPLSLGAAPRGSLRRPAAHRPGRGQHQGSEYALSTLQRTARDAGLGLDEIALAREFDSRDERESVLLRYVKALVGVERLAAAPPARGGSRGRMDGRADPRDDRPRGARHVRQPRHARGDVPLDGSSEDSRLTAPRRPPDRTRPCRGLRCTHGLGAAVAVRRHRAETCCGAYHQASSWWASAGPARSCSC